jgi:hypothetical protein
VGGSLFCIIEREASKHWVRMMITKPISITIYTIYLQLTEKVFLNFLSG